MEKTKDILRFTTAGSVDDGKSTLIGRLLYDAKAIMSDQVQAIAQSTLKKGKSGIDFAMFTDGLKEEREQGITIDVAYRYFTTPKRKFIIADSPGHFEFTRNMVTGASTANLALILIDARIGIVEQTRRHSFIASLLQIPHVLYCINKMDLIGYDGDRYAEIVEEIEDFAAKLDIPDVQFIPISALEGDNIASKSTHMYWYHGASLLHILENLFIANDWNMLDCRLPVQTIMKSSVDNQNQRIAGRMAGGTLRAGDEVLILPGQEKTRVHTIYGPQGALEEAFTPQSISIALEGNHKLQRGDLICRVNNVAKVGIKLEAMICWLGDEPHQSGKSYILMHTTRTSMAMVSDIIYKIDIFTLQRLQHQTTLNMNDIGRITLTLDSPICYDSYRRNRITGSFILVDRDNFQTVCAGMII
jgi:sulfate adenylyltransferase subunit 1